MLSQFTHVFDFLDNDLVFWLFLSVLLFSFEYVYSFIIYKKYNNKIIKVESGKVSLPNGRLLTINQKKSKKISDNEYMLVVDASVFYIALLMNLNYDDYVEFNRVKQENSK